MFQGRARTLSTQRMLGEGDVELFAAGRAPCVVAFHGFTGTASEMMPVLDRLTRKGRAVDAALLPGHGTRVENLQDLRYEDWLEGARHRMRTAVSRYGRVVLAGFSLGSLLALELASERPQGLAGLIVMGNALSLQPHDGIPLALAARLGQRLPDTYMLKAFPGDLLDRAQMGRLVTYDRHPVRAAVEVYRAGYRVRLLVGRVTCPTLILHGRRDHVCPWRNATWLADHLGTRDVSVRIFERSAHALALDYEREEVARETIAFVDRLAAQAQGEREEKQEEKEEKRI
jgi:carboxylesterase